MKLIQQLMENNSIPEPQDWVISVPDRVWGPQDFDGENEADQGAKHHMVVVRAGAERPLIQWLEKNYGQGGWNIKAVPHPRNRNFVHVELVTLWDADESGEWDASEEINNFMKQQNIPFVLRMHDDGPNEY